MISIVDYHSCYHGVLVKLLSSEMIRSVLWDSWVRQINPCYLFFTVNLFIFLMIKIRRNYHCSLTLSWPNCLNEYKCDITPHKDNFNVCFWLLLEFYFIAKFHECRIKMLKCNFIHPWEAS